MSSLINLQQPFNVCRASAGTGKTFTLAAYYVGLLLSGVSYRNILAVTFTNKATDEMKSRILSYLYAIAQNDRSQQAFFDKAKSFMISGSIPSDEDLRERAKECFRQMLSDYDNVCVSTIDSFLQTLLAGMTQLLGKGVGYTVELNIKQIISTAVDQILSTEMTDKIRELMAEYMKHQLGNEDNWDIRKSLIDIANDMYNESVQVLNAEGKIDFDSEHILKYKKALDNTWRKDKACDELRQMLDNVKLCSHCNQQSVKAQISNIETSLQDVKQLSSADAFRGLKPDMWKKISDTEPEKYRKTFGSDYDAICALQEQCIVCRGLYLQYKLTTEYLMDMRLMEGLQERINANLQEANRTLLINTAATLTQALKPGDADFVLEKAGIRYKHIMIDEFQDTSSLQWQVFLPLLKDVLASGGNTVLIVGDIKQSIYRWRNGDWHIMAQLGTNTDSLHHWFNKGFAPLVRNFRSRRNVVQFNLETMQKVVELCAEDNAYTDDEAQQLESLYDEQYKGENLADYYNASKEGGYVRFRAYPCFKKGQYSLAAQELNGQRVQNDILADMFTTIEGLLQQGERASDILILVRTNAEALDIVKYFTQLKDTQPDLALSRVSMVSSDSFQLDRSTSVLLAISALRYIDTGDQVSGKYIELLTKDSTSTKRLQQIDRQLPLYEMLQQVVRLLECDKQGQFLFDDIAYINCLLDKVRDYVYSFGSNRRAFLQYWDDTMHSDAISAPESNAIRVMTVHSAKGLESKTLFIPFCSWSMETESTKNNKIWCEAPTSTQEGVVSLKHIPIHDCSQMADTPLYKGAFEAEHKDQRIDSLNMLYVALTRAADNLYIYADVQMNKDGVSDKTVASLLLRAWNLQSEIIEEAKNYSDAEQPCFAEYSSGVAPYIHKDEGKKAEQLFGFNNAKELQAGLCSSGDVVRFRQSQESAIYTALSGNAEDMLEHINLGNICHDILSQVAVREQLTHVIDDFYMRGIIDTEEQKQKISELINRAWTEEKLCDWFSGRWTLLREQAILVNGTECRPDRVMIRDKHAIVLDYKFGAKQDKYATQVRGYMDAMRQLGYSDVEGYLWYAQSRTLEEIK